MTIFSTWEGHSLLMVQVRNKINSAFNRELSIVELFKYPTIHMLAGYLSRTPDKDASADAGLDRAEKRSARGDSG